MLIFTLLYGLLHKSLIKGSATSGRELVTPDGNLLGSWIGRTGRGLPRSNLQWGYRLQEVSKDFIGGGRDVDDSLHSNLRLTSNLAVSGFLQYEQWNFPILSLSKQANVTASIQVTYYPRWQR